MMRPKRADALRKIPAMLRVLRDQVKEWKPPIVGRFATGKNAPFKVLISTVLSLRTKDMTTEAAARRLFEAADTPEALLKISVKQIEGLIYPVGFYRTKARNIREICRVLIDKFDGEVPSDIDTLLTLKGVGRKTANLVVTVGYGKPGICVDTHVHRISNRWGLVKTDTPDETEAALRKILPPRYWIEYNDLLVCFGQNLCLPVSPFCSRCKIRGLCPRLGIRSSR